MKNMVTLLAVTVLLVGCGPDIKLGPGTVISADGGELEYRQDNNWVFSTGRSSVHAKDLAGTHCDALYLYAEVNYVESMNGKNCHAPEPIALQWTCLAANDKGFKAVPCEIAKENKSTK